MPTTTINVPASGDSTSQSQSRTVTISDLSSVTSVTVNTGSVTYSLSGKDITVNCSGGASVRSSSYTPNKSASDYRTGSGSSSSSYPSTVPYNDGTYSGNLSQSGTPYVTSGGLYSTTGTGFRTVSPGPVYADTFPSTIHYDDGVYSGDIPKSGSVYQSGGSAPVKKSTPGTGHYDVNSSNPQTSDFPTTIHYDDGTYSGDIPKSGYFYNVGTDVWRQDYSGDVYSADTRIWRQDYSGTVYQDTRVWRQDYSGTVYGTTQYTYYYAYVVTVNYVANVQIGSYKVKVASGILTIPIFDPSTTSSPLRIKTPKGIGVFKLVPTTDTNASAIRVKTATGIKAISKV